MRDDDAAATFRLLQPQHALQGIANMRWRSRLLLASDAPTRKHEQRPVTGAIATERKKLETQCSVKSPAVLFALLARLGPAGSAETTATQNVDRSGLVVLVRSVLGDRAVVSLTDSNPLSSAILRLPEQGVVTGGDTFFPFRAPIILLIGGRTRARKARKREDLSQGVIQRAPAASWALNLISLQMPRCPPVRVILIPARSSRSLNSLRLPMYSLRGSAHFEQSAQSSFTDAVP
jgi:hypothetical protein